LTWVKRAQEEAALYPVEAKKSTGVTGACRGLLHRSAQLFGSVSAAVLDDIAALSLGLRIQ
jgi:hypothetical protein